jgi:SAM-dependent methyltransferase
MAHQEQADFCRRIAARWPHLFIDKKVLDCGSLDINGNNRHLFTGGTYLGIDIVAGTNVDVVTSVHEYNEGQFDVVISTECFEHDAHFAETFAHMISMVAVGGLLLFTCATTGRPEHGTKAIEDWASPGTLDHYRNITVEDVIVPLRAAFKCCGVEVEHSDLYGWAIDLRA